ncbi:hypothetical protein KATP_38870 [Kluyvera ascorbata]|nr:hypothetical protein KATP_38870 [Kluyvera ascorbata]
MTLFQYAHIKLAQTRIERHAAAAGIRNDLGGTTRTAQIAGNDMSDTVGAYTLTDLDGLLLSFSRQGAIGLALNTPFGVPLRFAMANKIYL